MTNAPRPGAYLSASMDPDGVMAWLEERIAAVSLIPRENGEVCGRMGSGSVCSQPSFVGLQLWSPGAGSHGVVWVQDRWFGLVC